MNKLTKTFGLSFTEIKLSTLGSAILAGDHSGEMIVTPNVDHIVRLNNDTLFRDSYLNADLFVNDSRILRLLSSFGLNKITSLIPGSDLTKWLFEHASQNTQFTIIGASEETISTVKSNFSLVHINHYNPPMGFIDNPSEVNKCLDFCKKNTADIYFFAVGSPRQEYLASRLKGQGVEGALLCVGASILFLTGEEKRAPTYIQKANMEWLFRLIQNPRRLAKRYLIDGMKIFPIYIRELLK